MADENYFSIYALKPEYKAHCDFSVKRQHSSYNLIDREMYNLVYREPIGNTLIPKRQMLDSIIIHIFHNEKVPIPDLRDIVSITYNGKETAYFKERQGYVEVPEFTAFRTIAAANSNYNGYVALMGKDNKVYLGKKENYMFNKENGFLPFYKNDDNSLIFVSENKNMFSFLNGEDKAYFCDSFGFTEVPEFLGQPKIIREQPEQTQTEQPEVKPQTMTVLIVEPMQEPYVKEISTDLKALQNEVDGNIEVIYPFAEQIGLICNDAGKINCMQLNRAVYDAEGEMCEIIAGTFVLAGLGEESFTSLSPEQIKDFTDKFKNPEIFVKVNNKIAAIPVKPSIKAKLNRLQKEQDGKDKPAPEKKPPNTEL